MKYHNNFDAKAERLHWSIWHRANIFTTENWWWKQLKQELKWNKYYENK